MARTLEGGERSYDAHSFSIARGGKEGCLSRIIFKKIDVNNVFVVQDILEMLKDPKNMIHLAGVSLTTGISDMIMYYGDSKRDGRVALDGDDVVGIFDIYPMGSSSQPLSPEGTSWEIRSAVLNRLCTHSDEQRKGIGTQTVAYAEEVAFEEHDYSAIIGALILDEEQKKAFEKARKSDKMNEFIEEFKKDDPRGKLFMRNRKWTLVGILRDQGGYKDELTHVLLVQKTKADWIKEKREQERRRSQQRSSPRLQSV